MSVEIKQEEALLMVSVPNWENRREADHYPQTRDLFSDSTDVISLT